VSDFFRAALALSARRWRSVVDKEEGIGRFALGRSVVRNEIFAILGKRSAHSMSFQVSSKPLSRYQEILDSDV